MHRAENGPLIACTRLHNILSACAGAVCRLLVGLLCTEGRDPAMASGVFYPVQK